MHDMLLHSWASRLESVDVAGLDVTHRTGIVTRDDAYLSPLAERAIELVELTVAEDQRKSARRRR